MPYTMSEIRRPAVLAIHRETIGNQCQHRGHSDTNLRVGRYFIQAENGIRHHHNKNEGKNHFQNVVLHVARSGELEDVTRKLQTRPKRVNHVLDVPLFDSPIWQSDRWRDSAGLLETGVNPPLIRHELDLVRPISNGDKLDAK